MNLLCFIIGGLVGALGMAVMAANTVNYWRDHAAWADQEINEWKSAYHNLAAQVLKEKGGK